MVTINASIGTELYAIELTSATGNRIIADEPVEKGGKDKGFSPKELLASALASCTCATLRMYVEHKGWHLEQVHVRVEMAEEGEHTTFVRTIELVGQLDEGQRTRLLNVANACPVHKILTHTIAIETTLM